MLVEQWEVERLRANPENYKKHPPEQLEDIRASIARFGWREPIVARPSDGMIFAGHGRLAVAIEQNMAWVPVAPWECSDAEGSAYLVADNETQRRGIDDDSQLAKLLKKIQADEGGLEGTGYQDKEVEALLAIVDKAPASAPASVDKPQEPAAVEERTQSKRGAVYVLGAFRVMCVGARIARPDVDGLMQQGMVTCSDLRHVDELRRRWTRYAQANSIDPGPDALEG